MTSEERGEEGLDSGAGGIVGAVDGPIPRMNEICKHLEWFISTYDLDWPDINSEDIFDNDSAITDKYRSLQRGARPDQYIDDVDEYGDALEN